MSVPRPPHPRGPFSIGKIGEVPRILDAKGRDVMTLPGGIERLVECANAIRHDVWFPCNHVPQLERDVVKLEQLRKEAWAKFQALESEISHLSPNVPQAADTPAGSPPSSQSQRPAGKNSSEALQ